MPVDGSQRSAIGGFELRPDLRLPSANYRRRGSVLVLAMILVAVLALIATAFIITARLEGKAATNSLRGVQAETACQVGLAAAIYQISATHQSCYRLDSATGWHGYFRDTAATAPDLCPYTWVRHYDATQPGHEMKAKRWQLGRIAPGDTSSGSIQKLKRTRGFTSDYYVAVADLDGKLHANPWYYYNLLDDTAPEHQTQDMLDSLLLPVLVRNAVLNDSTSHYSLGSLRAEVLATGFTDNSMTSKNELNLVEDFFTIYPRVASITVKGDVGRPAVNVNTARKEVLEAIVLNVPNLAAKAAVIAQKLVDERPFADRKDMEKALVELGQKAWNGPPSNLPPGYEAKDDVLTEEQLNDLLNSLAGANTANESDLDRPGDPSGIYSYDSDNSQSGDHTKGDHTVDAVEPLSADYTWGTEVKFTSRFFHIYVMGQTVADDAERRALAKRRVHAVYDALTRKVLWKRRHFYPKANMAD